MPLRGAALLQPSRLHGGRIRVKRDSIILPDAVGVAWRIATRPWQRHGSNRGSTPTTNPKTYNVKPFVPPLDDPYSTKPLLSA